DLPRQPDGDPRDGHLQEQRGSLRRGSDRDAALGRPVEKSAHRTGLSEGEGLDGARAQAGAVDGAGGRRDVHGRAHHESPAEPPARSDDAGSDGRVSVARVGGPRARRRREGREDCRPEGQGASEDARLRRPERTRRAVGSPELVRIAGRVTPARDPDARRGRAAPGARRLHPSAIRACVRDACPSGSGRILMSGTPNASEKARAVSLTDEEAVKEILAASVLDLWKVVNNLTRLKPSRRERYRVAIFGSARAKPGTFVYDEVKRAAAAFAAMGCDIVTGGGPGLMQAANEGAKEAGAPGSVGIRVELPFEQDVNPFVEQAFEHETFFTRLHHFVIASDVFVVVPGG